MFWVGLIVGFLVGGFIVYWLMPKVAKIETDVAKVKTDISDLK